jgi:hypothetical protein
MGLFVFFTVVVASSMMFSSSFESKKFTQSAQKKYDVAFGALGEVGKIISTSTVMEANDSANMNGANSILVYSYSTPANECKKFRFSNKQLIVYERDVPDGDPYTNCNSAFMSSGATTQKIIVDKFIKGRFIWRKLDTSTAGSEVSGMVTIFAQAYASDPDVGSPSFIPMQTTVSLRDYLGQ